MSFTDLKHPWSIQVSGRSADHDVFRQSGPMAIASLLKSRPMAIAGLWQGGDIESVKMGKPERAVATYNCQYS